MMLPGRDLKTNFGFVSLAAPDATSSSGSRYSRTQPGLAEIEFSGGQAIGEVAVHGLQRVHHSVVHVVDQNAHLLELGFVNSGPSRKRGGKRTVKG